ncbi:chromate transport protein ChrA [Evansella vedderi]|uniref:Chromate transport protein ChrA n=1 Tax=Evansella vedderi TaxID=38282 RepID=A0ABT9ZXE0_9BACI|nr:chromate transport protein ChrA [Evansella vedderi]
MYQNRVSMIIFLIFWIFVLRLFFFEEERSLIHFLLGSTIFVVLLIRYKTLSKTKRKLQGNITLFVSAVVLIFLFFWYIQPFFI